MNSSFNARFLLLFALITGFFSLIYTAQARTATGKPPLKNGGKNNKVIILLKPDVLISIPFGVKSTSRMKMPYVPERNLTKIGEGYPTAFKLDNKGRLHLLIAGINKILVFENDGKFKEAIQLKGPSDEELPAEAYLYDMAIEKSGTYLILDQSGGWITRFTAKGNALTSFGHIVYGSSMYLTEQGKLIVADAALSLLDVFDTKGMFLNDIKGPNTFPEASLKGQLVRSRTMSFNKSLLWLRHMSNTTPRLLTVISSEHEGAKLYEATPIGFNSQNKICLITTEKTSDKTYYSYIQYIHEDGTRLEKYAVAPNMERVADMARTWSLEKDDRILTFRTTNGQYQIIAYSTKTGL